MINVKTHRVKGSNRIFSLKIPWMFPNLKRIFPDVTQILQNKYSNNLDHLVGHSSIEN